MRAFQIVFILLFFSPITKVNGQTNYFVSKDGNDNNNGTTLGTAWLTIQHAANIAIPNSVVNILAGTYNELVSINVSGTINNPIKFKNFQNGIVVISGTGATAAHSSLLSISDRSNIIIDSLIFEGLAAPDATGVFVGNYGGTTENISLTNLKVRNIGYIGNDHAHGIWVYGAGATLGNSIKNARIENCEVYNNKNGGSENITINGNVNGYRILNNSVHDNTNIGIDAAGNYAVSKNAELDHARNGIISGNITFNNVAPSPFNAGIDCDGCQNTIIEKNISHHNPVGIALACEQSGSTDNDTIRNNFVFLNTYTGLAIGGHNPATTGVVQNSVIRNNTCYHNNPSNESGEMRIAKTLGCQFFNNIANSDGNFLFYVDDISPQTFTSDYNLFYTTQGNSVSALVRYHSLTTMNYDSYKNTTGRETYSHFSNPQFVNITLSSLDLHLKSNSPAINSGNPSFIPSPEEKDIDGEVRANGIVDIGADEYYQPLPINLLSFSSSCINGFIKLSWSTSSEINSNYFAVEKSFDGNNWKEAGIINSHINSSRIEDYLFIDPEVMQQTTYYRLKQFDFDGQHIYSKILQVKTCVENWRTLSIYPNPADSYLNIILNNPIGKQQVQIYNSLGLIVKDVELTQAIKIDVSNLSKGIYFIRLLNYPAVVQKFIKK